MPMIHIRDWISFTATNVLVHEKGLKASPEELYEAVATAWSHTKDQELVDACSGGQGPLAKFGDIPYEEYLVLKQVFDKVRNVNES